MTTPDPEPTSEIDIEADIAEVWEALTTDDGLAGWMGEGATIDSEVDGELSAPDPVGGRPRQGRVDEIESHERIGFTWWPEADPSDRSRVTISLEPTETGTHVRVIERPLTVAVTTHPTPICRAAWVWRVATLRFATSRVCV